MEGAIKYHREVDLQDQTSVGKISRWVPQGSKVLEVGPATGVMTRILSEKLGCHVTCLEIDPQAAEIAKPLCAVMHVGDIETFDLDVHFERQSFDVIIFADVLEHLRDPWRTLERVLPLLKSDGLLLASIPNVGHAGLVLELIDGHFRYRRDGLLDETHLRFFTRESVEDLFKKTGFRVVEWNRTQLRPEFSEFGNSLKKVAKSLRDALQANPDWDTYQFLVRAVPNSSQVVELPRKESETRAATDVTGKRLVQVFVDLGQGFSEEGSLSRLVANTPGRVKEIFTFEAISRVQPRRIRVDPSDTLEVVKVHSIAVYDEQREWFRWDAATAPLTGVAQFQEAGELRFLGHSYLLPYTDDPRLLITLPEGMQITERLHVALELEGGITGDVPALLEQLLREHSERGRKVENLLLSVDELTHSLSEAERLRSSLEEQIAELQAVRLAQGRELEAMRSHVSELEQQKAHVAPELEQALAHAQGQLHQIQHSRSWALATRLQRMAANARKGRELARTLARHAKRAMLSTRPGAQLLSTMNRLHGEEVYKAWQVLHEPNAAELSRMREESGKLAYQPLISVVIPVYKARVAWLRAAIDSVRAQAYPNWELCIADDASDSPVLHELLSAYMAEDTRIKVVFRPSNGHISESSNSALEVAAGEFIAFMDHDDMLTPHALFEVVRFLNTNRDLDLIYSDEDKIDEQGNRSEPTFKPEWSPDYFRSFMYIGHLSVYRRTLVKEAGGFRKGLEGSQDYDLALRVVERGARVGHIPTVLYHWRAHQESVAGNQDSKPYAFAAAVRALTDSLARTGEASPKVENTAVRGIYRVRRSVNADSRIAVVRFGQGAPSALPNHRFHNLCEHTLDSGNPEALRNFLHSLDRNAFDFAVLIDRELVVPSADSLESLLEPLADKASVGAFGKIVSSDGHILHAGYTIRSSRVHPNFSGCSTCEVGCGGRLVTINNISAGSLRFAAFKTEALLQALPETGHASLLGLELDLCLSLRRLGYLTWTPHAVAEFSGPRAPEAPIDLASLPHDYALLRARHTIERFRDPFYPHGLDEPSKPFVFGK